TSHLLFWRAVVFLFELRVLLQSFGLLHVLGLARFGATRFHMLSHCRVHFLSLLGRKIEFGQRNTARHVHFLLLILKLHHPVAAFARKQGRCPKAFHWNSGNGLIHKRDLTGGLRPL